MPAEGLEWIDGSHLLSTPEMIRLVDIATRLGIEQVRLTGGEPLLRPDVVDVVAGVSALDRAPRLSLTTNGLRLPGLAQPLADAGLTRVNISLDSLDRETFKRLTLRDRLNDTLAGITAASEAGLRPVKINSVLIRGVNDGEAPALVRWALARGYELRFIEQMPLDPQHGWNRAMMVTRAEILDSLSAAGLTLVPAEGRGSAPAEVFAVSAPDIPAGAVIGVVGSVTAPFCSACDRVRLTADGQWRSCLFATTETDLRGPMREGASDDDLALLMVGDTALKGPGHGIDEPGFAQPARPMSAIGG